MVISNNNLGYTNQYTYNTNTTALTPHSTSVFSAPSSSTNATTSNGYTTTTGVVRNWSISPGVVNQVANTTPSSPLSVPRMLSNPGTPTILPTSLPVLSNTMPTTPWNTQGVTWMPIIRTITPPTGSRPPAHPEVTEKVTEKPTSNSNDSTGENPQKLTGRAAFPVDGTNLPDEALETEDVKIGADRKTSKTSEAPATALTPAEETGQKIGKFATQILEENPQLQQKVDQLDLNTMMADPTSFVNRFRNSFQQSRLFKMMPKWLDGRIATLFPREMEPIAEDVLKWLRTGATNNIESPKHTNNKTKDPTRAELKAAEKDPVKKSGHYHPKDKPSHKPSKSDRKEMPIEELMRSLGEGQASKSSRLDF